MNRKKCPSCGYENAAENPQCGVCGCDVSLVAPAPGKRKNAGLFLVPLLIASAFGAYFFFPMFLGQSEKKGMETFVEEKGALNPRTMKYSLENIGVLKFPDDAEEKNVFAAMESADPEIRKIAAGTLFLWASFRGPGFKLYLEKACSALKDKDPSVKASAAVMLAEIMKRGIFSASDLGDTLPDPVLFMEDGDRGVRAAGAYLLLFLERREDASQSAYRNLSDSSGDKEKAYYSCLLAKYGEKGAAGALKELSASKDPEASETASFCLKKFPSPDK